MEKTPADRIGEEVRSAFPQGAIQQVQLLQYGDDPEIEPGQVAIRILTGQTAGPGDQSGHETLRRFVQASHEAIHRLRREQPAIGWIEFRLLGEPFTAEHGPVIRTGPGWQDITSGQAGDELTPVTTRLGPEELATVDGLITSGVAGSRAEVLRWALGRATHR